MRAGDAAPAADVRIADGPSGHPRGTRTLFNTDITWAEGPAARCNKVARLMCVEQ